MLISFQFLNNPGLIGGVFVVATLAGVAYLGYGARDATQRDFPSVYGGKSKRKTKRLIFSKVVSVLVNSGEELEHII